MKSRFLIFLTALMIVTGLFASQTLTSELVLTEEEEKFLSFMDYDNAENIVRYLSVGIGNRTTSSIGADQAADYFMTQLKLYGYEPILHEFDIREAASGAAASSANQRNNGYVEINGKRYMYFGPTYAGSTVYQFTNNTVNTTGAIVLDWPSTGANFQTYASLDVPVGDYTGKAVFVRTGTGPTNNASAAAAPSAAQYYNAALALQTAGAQAVIFQWREPRSISISPLPPFNGKTTGSDTTYAQIGNTTSGTAISIPVGTTNYVDTNSILSGLSADTPIRVNMRTRFDGKNVIAVLPSATGSKKTVYVTAHYDSVISGSGGNDNSSGPSMLMEMARAWKQSEVLFEHNIVFALFNPEEAFSMRGSRRFITDFIEKEKDEIFKAENFAGLYNMDQIATGEPECIYMHISIHNADINTLQNALANTTDRLIDVPQALVIANEYTGFRHVYQAVQKLQNSGRHKDKKITFKKSSLNPLDYLSYEKDLNGDYIYDDFNILDNFSIVYGAGTDNYPFAQAGISTNSQFLHENLKNSMQCFSWRKSLKGIPMTGTGGTLETVYHTVGDTYNNNYSRAKHEIDGDTLALAVFYSAGGSVVLEEEECWLGCNASYALIVLLAVVPFFFMKKR
ncbi:MAG: M28 family peptidase [Synergistaceae bacterium]|nr:M28 family peptidase [Synergistaceae bacterium]